MPNQGVAAAAAAARLHTHFCWFGFEFGLAVHVDVVVAVSLGQHRSRWWGQQLAGMGWGSCAQLGWAGEICAQLGTRGVRLWQHQPLVWPSSLLLTLVHTAILLPCHDTVSCLPECALNVPLLSLS